MKREAERDAIAGHESRNRELVTRILAKGGSLTVARVLDLFFWAPSQTAGTSLAAALVVLGLTNLKVTPAADSGQEWCVEGQLYASVQHMTNSLFTRQLVRLAIEHKSEYDGWGTEL